MVKNKEIKINYPDLHHLQEGMKFPPKIHLYLTNITICLKFFSGETMKTNGSSRLNREHFQNEKKPETFESENILKFSEKLAQTEKNFQH